MIRYPRLSSLTAPRMIREAIPAVPSGTPRQRHRIDRRALADIVAVPVPPRANRLEARAVKQPPSPYHLKRLRHRHWPQPTKPFRDAIVPLN